MSWPKVRIGDFTSVVTKGTTPTKAQGFAERGINYIKAESLNGDGALDLSGGFFISEEIHNILKRSILKEGDVLLTIAGANIGKCGIVEEHHLPANTNQAVGIMRVDRKQVHPRFLYYWFKQGQTFRYIQGLNAQAAQPNINLSMLRNIEVPLPPPTVQNRIISILSAYDDLIENNRRRIQLLELAARLLYREWFVHLRFPGHEHVKVTDGVPEGWEKKKFGELCEEVREIVKPNALEPDTPYIGLEHMPRRSISLSQWASTKQVTSSKHRFNEGDILFGKIRPYFHKVGITFVDGVASSDAIVIKPRERRLLSFVLLTASSDAFVAMTSQTVREGSKMPRADWKQMQAYPLPLPPPTFLKTFDEFIQKILNQLKTLVLMNQKLQNARDLILPRLMNGELAV
jgi:type I restriction enzyme S subunit